MYLLIAVWVVRELYLQSECDRIILQTNRNSEEKIMIIWINGAFGSGKSSVAECICKELDNAYLYDPEQVGYFLWDNFPENLKRKSNFQYIPLWREFNYKILKYIDSNYNGIIVVPMTIYKKQYYDEIIGQLRKENVEVKHFILSASKQTIADRLIKRGESKDCWAAQHINICLKAFESDISEEKINTEFKKIDEIADEIINKSI